MKEYNIISRIIKQICFLILLISIAISLITTGIILAILGDIVMLCLLNVAFVFIITAFGLTTRLWCEMTDLVDEIKNKNEDNKNEN